MSTPSPLRWMPAPLDVVVSDTVVEQDAPPLVPPTLEEIQAIQDAAYREGLERGLAEGHAEGFAQGQAEVRRLAAQMEGILDNFSRPLDRLENEVVAALSELAVRIAGALVGRAYAADPTLLADLVREALDAVGSGSREIELRLQPDDFNVLAPHLSGLAGVRVTPDLSLGRGELRLHSEGVRVDGTIAARLQSVIEHMQAEDAEP